MTTALVHGVRLNYVQAVPDHGPVEDLVMVHGLSTNLAFWYLQYAAAFSKRYRVTFYDLRGHGRSETTPSGYRPSDLSNDLRGLLDHLGIRRAHFVAHSFGGVIALDLACADPQRVASLVLADTHIAAARSGTAGRDWSQRARMQKLLDNSGIDLDTRDPYFGYQLLTVAARLQSSGRSVPPELADLVGPLLGRHGGRTAAQWLALMEETTAEAELMGDDGLSPEALKKLRFPILAMYGDHSQARLTGSEFLRLWPHAEFRRVRQAGHFFPTTRSAEVIETCERFWDGAFRASPAQRAGEGGERHFRSERIYRSEGAWYCLTREAEPLGPFAVEEEAREELTSYISAMGGLETA